MTTTFGTSRDNPRVDLAVGDGADLKSEPHLSVGQLQEALRTARGTAIRLDVVTQVNSGQEDHVDKRDQESDVVDQPPSARWLTGNGFRIFLWRMLGLRNVRALLAARKIRRTTGERIDSAPTVGVWNVPGSGWSGSFYDSARRWTTLLAALMLLLVGAVTVAGRLLAIAHPAPGVVAAAPRVSDLQFGGAAQGAVLDYLSWDQTAPRTTRMNALARWGFAGALGDGWDGTGRLDTENVVVMAVLRTGDDGAVVTVQARTVHQTPTAAIATDANKANPGTPPGTTMWLTLAVPVAVSASRILVTAPPALVGSTPTQAQGPGVTTAASEDTEAGRASADTVNKLIAAYGSGDLEFARGPGSTFTELAGMVTSGQVQSWRMAKTQAGEDPLLRAGDVTVLWTLPDGVGQLRCRYWIQLAQRENRWLLQQITPALGES